MTFEQQCRAEERIAAREELAASRGVRINPSPYSIWAEGREYWRQDLKREMRDGKARSILLAFIQERGAVQGWDAE